MKDRPGQVFVAGELHLSIEVLAASYRVDTRLVRAFVEHGLLGPSVQVGAEHLWPAARLDSMADILRLHERQGLALEAIAALFEFQGRIE